MFDTHSNGSMPYMNGNGVGHSVLNGNASQTVSGIDTAVEHDRLSLNVAADRLLSLCWQKACQFARNFGSPQISIELLLLGATHVREADAVLALASPNIESLNHKLAERCARRSFAQAPSEARSLTADKTLKGLLCGAAALAAAQETPNLTLSLLLEAISLHDPVLPVLDVCPNLAPPLPQPRSALLEDIADRLSVIEEKLDSPPLTVSTPMIHPEAFEQISARFNDLEAAILRVAESRFATPALVTPQPSQPAPKKGWFGR